MPQATGRSVHPKKLLLSWTTAKAKKKNQPSKMILKRVKGALHSSEFSVGAVATGREARGLTSSESCRDCVHGKFQLCASSASKLQRSLPPTSRFNIFWHQNIRTVALSVSGFCLGSAVVGKHSLQLPDLRWGPGGTQGSTMASLYQHFN